MVGWARRSILAQAGPPTASRAEQQPRAARSGASSVGLAIEPANHIRLDSSSSSQTPFGSLSLSTLGVLTCRYIVPTSTIAALHQRGFRRPPPIGRLYLTKPGSACVCSTWYSPTLMTGSSRFSAGADMFLKNSAAIRRLPDVVVRSLPPISAIYPSQISRARCLPGMTAGGWSIEHRPTASSEANSSPVITLGSGP